MPQRSPGPFFAPLSLAPAGAPAPLFTPGSTAHLQRGPGSRRSPRLTDDRPASSSPTGPEASSGPRPSSSPARRSPRGRHDPGPGGTISGRLAAAAVAAGALATAGHGVATGLDAPTTGEATLTADSLALPAAPATSPARPTTDAATTDVLPVSAAAHSAPSGQVEALSKSRKRADEAAAARAPAFVKPAQGRFTSGFGARWGTSHEGIDIANAIGTPIVSVADGVVTAAGPASGFGQWVKVRLADGTETIYGHVNRFFVHTGDTVTAGQRIAEIGNRGQSTGPHLHFEVHTPAGRKVNPQPWLAERGISLGAQAD